MRIWMRWCARAICRVAAVVGTVTLVIWVATPVAYASDCANYNDCNGSLAAWLIAIAALALIIGLLVFALPEILAAGAVEEGVLGGELSLVEAAEGGELSEAAEAGELSEAAEGADAEAEEEAGAEGGPGDHSAFPDDYQQPYIPGEGDPVYGQSNGQSCVAASSQMVAESMDYDISEDAVLQLAQQTDPTFVPGEDGIYLKDVPDMLQQLGGPNATYVENATIDSVQTATSEGNPAIVSVKTPGVGAHSLVVDGVTQTDAGPSVLVRDPLPVGEGSSYQVLAKDFAPYMTGRAVFFP